MIANAKPGARSPRQFLDERGVYQIVFRPMMGMCVKLMEAFPNLDGDRAERLAAGLMAAILRGGNPFGAEQVAVEVTQALVADRMSGDQFRSLRESAPLFIDAMFIEAGGEAEAFIRYGVAGTYPADLIWKALDALAEDRW